MGGAAGPAPGPGPGPAAVPDSDCVGHCQRLPLVGLRSNVRRSQVEVTMRLLLNFKGDVRASAAAAACLIELRLLTIMIEPVHRRHTGFKFHLPPAPDYESVLSLPVSRSPSGPSDSSDSGKALRLAVTVTASGTCPSLQSR